MTFNEILDLIDTNLADASNITPTEHRAVETAILQYIEDQRKYLPKLTGWFVIPDVHAGSIDSLFSRSGDVTTAVLKYLDGNASTVKVTLSSAMPSMNYKVKCQPETLGDTAQGSSIGSVTFGKISTTEFWVTVREFSGTTQNLKIHLEIISLD